MNHAWIHSPITSDLVCDHCGEHVDVGKQYVGECPTPVVEEPKVKSKK